MLKEKKMDLTNKKELAARTLGVGVGRVMFNTNRIDEIKEAITKQDIRDLVVDNAIFVREIKGRKTNEKRKRRRAGSIRMKPNTRKRDYITITRKLRNYISELRKQTKLSDGEYLKLRNEIRSKNFRNKGHIKERISLMQNEKIGGKK
jgi:large subunit ribosomal protein L19e